MYVAIGFALANSTMIEGPDSVIIVDVTGSPAAAEEVKAAFTEITNKPIKANIYTHSHGDHTGGATAFAKDDNPKIYAHERFNGVRSGAISSKSLRFALSGNLALHFHLTYS